MVFYLLGSIIVWLIDCFEAESEKKLKEEEEVIEKSAEDQDGVEGQESLEPSNGGQEETEVDESQESEESGMN